MCLAMSPEEMVHDDGMPMKDGAGGGGAAASCRAFRRYTHVGQVGQLTNDTCLVKRVLGAVLAGTK